MSSGACIITEHAMVVGALQTGTYLCSVFPSSPRLWGDAVWFLLAMGLFSDCC